MSAPRFNDIVPPTLKKQRTCFLCSLVKTEDQFVARGCDNCRFLKMKNDRERVLQCTTTQFEGLIAKIGAETSWVARWQNVSKFVPGIYSVATQGTPSDALIEEFEGMGINFRLRDGKD